MARVELMWKPAQLQFDGPILRVAIGVPHLELEEAAAVGLEFPPKLTINALIDTGASVTVVNPEVAIGRKLRQTGFANIIAAGSSGRYPEHAAAISFPGTALKGFQVIRVVACSIVRQPISCLIGRDILRAWKLRYDGTTGRVLIED
jgi:hypothetical protein